MKTTYLYVKKHVNTGLLYLGVTTKDPYKYLGSGLYWKKHLENHGKNIITCVIGEYEDVDECSLAALEYSEKNNVVKSSAWANLKPENAKQGWVPGMPQTKESIAKRVIKLRGRAFTEEHKRKIGDTRRGDKHWTYGKPKETMFWFGRKHTPESIEKMKLIKARDVNPLTGRKRSQQIIENMTGEKNQFYGKHHTKKTKQLISEKNRGRKITEEHRKKISGVNSKSAKQFVAIDPNGNIYNGVNLTMFSKEHGLQANLMLSVANGVQKQHKGWTAQYVQQDQRGAK